MKIPYLEKIMIFFNVKNSDVLVFTHPLGSFPLDFRAILDTLGIFVTDSDVWTHTENLLTDEKSAG